MTVNDISLGSGLLVGQHEISEVVTACIKIYEHFDVLLTIIKNIMGRLIT